MISTTHVTTGAAVGLFIESIIPNPIIAIPLALVAGVVSHHLLDAIPHTDAGSFRGEGHKDDPLSKQEIQFAFIDNIIAAFVLIWIFLIRHPSWPMMFGAVGGNFPDLFHHPPFWQDYTRKTISAKYFALHKRFHRTARGNLIVFGLLTNVFFIALSLYYLLALNSNTL